MGNARRSCGRCSGILVLILPARVQIAQTELNNKLTAVGEEADRKNAEISSLNQQIETLTKENDELTAQNSKLSGADGSMSAVEALLNAASVYMETPDDIEALSEAVDKISRDAMESSDTSEAARKLYQQLCRTLAQTLQRTIMTPATRHIVPGIMRRRLKT